MTRGQQPEALVFANDRPSSIGDDLYQWAIDAETLIRAQRSRIAELEAQLDAIGAGGVEPLRKSAAAQQAVQAAVPVNVAEVIKLSEEIAYMAALTTAEAHRGANVSTKIEQSQELKQKFIAAVTALATTQPAAQGMDAQIIQALSAGMSIEQWQSSVDVRIGSSDLLGRAIANGEESRIELVRRAVSEALAAQAKQGEQANG